MRFNRIDLNLLVALDALLTERNVTRAGERLFLSQSAMSGALGRLRDHFGDELIVRAGRAMVLTPFAESLIGPVQALLHQMQAVFERRPDFDPAVSDRHFRIAASDFVIALFLADLVREIEQVAPSVTIEIYDVTGQDASGDLEKGETDLLIVPKGRASSRHPSIELFHDDWCVLAWRGNRWLGDALNLDAYLSAQHVAVNFGRGHRPGIVERALAEQHLTRNVAIWASNYHLVSEMVAGTDRIATAPHRLAQRVAEAHDLRVYPLPLVLPAIDEVIQWNRFHDEDPGLTWLRGKLLEVVRDGNEPGPPEAI
jgi:DNA-binding transcriptional LysR family regulator